MFRETRDLPVVYPHSLAVSVQRRIPQEELCFCDDFVFQDSIAIIILDMRRSARTAHLLDKFGKEHLQVWLDSMIGSLLAYLPVLEVP